MNRATIILRGEFESLAALAYALTRPEHDGVEVVVLNQAGGETFTHEIGIALRQLGNINNNRTIGTLNWGMALGMFPMAVADAIAMGDTGDTHTIYSSFVHNTADRVPAKDERFRARLEQLANLSQGLAPSDENTVHLLAPTINMTLGEAITFGYQQPMFKFLVTRVGDIDGTRRAAGFRQAGIPDPYVIAHWRAGLRKLPRSSNYDAVRVTLALDDSETEEAPQP